MARPKKSKGPFSVEEWLRFVLRGKRPEDRWKIFKEWRRWALKQNSNQEPTPEEMEAEIRKWRKFQFNFLQSEGHLIDNLKMDFIPIYRKQNRIERASKGGKGLSKKRKSSN